LCHFSEDCDPAPAKKQKRTGMSSAVQQSGAIDRMSSSSTRSSTLHRGSAAPAAASRDGRITSAAESGPSLLAARGRSSSTAGTGAHGETQTRSKSSIDSEVDFPSLLRRGDSPPVS